MARYVLVSAAAAKTKVQEKTQKRKFNSCYFFSVQNFAPFSMGCEIVRRKIQKSKCYSFF